MSKELDILEEFIKRKFKEKKNIFFPKHSKYKYTILLINIVHLILTIFFSMFIFFPSNFQLFFITYFSFIMFLWYIFDDWCILTLFTNWLSDIKDDENESLFPLTNDLLYIIISVFIFISTLFYLYPKLSLFHFLSKFDIKR